MESGDPASESGWISRYTLLMMSIRSCVKLSFDFDLTQFQSLDINLQRYRTYRCTDKFIWTNWTSLLIRFQLPLGLRIYREWIFSVSSCVNMKPNIFFCTYIWFANCYIASSTFGLLHATDLLLWSCPGGLGVGGPRIKSPQKVWNIFETVELFWIIMVYRFVHHCKTWSFCFTILPYL